MFTVFATSLDRSLGFLEKYDLTRMEVLLSESGNKMLSAQRSGEWVDSDLVKMRSKIKNFKNVFKKTFPPHCSSCLCPLKVRHLKHFVDFLERFGIM